ncbi:response regulator [Pseudomonas japonica]|uniref:Response regulator receiver domain-containing protein n=1 Tax=Pseudomonas japonica TaxID=256466 RepID=A0A239H1C1_9PSED|nr:response regulator [Pseudomonas japonica]SNS74971.1 Response regulator receiver domain-containing protein [Pseudomonas japonica]
MPEQDDLLSDAEREALAEITAPPATPQKVLIVDDDEDASELLAEILKTYGIESLALTSAKQALQLILCDRNIGLLITDLRMTPFDGLELIRKIRESEKAALPIIIISGDAQVQDAITAMHLSVVDFMLKPIDVGKLMPLVRRELGV